MLSAIASRLRSRDRVLDSVCCGIRIELNEVFLESQFPRSGLVSPLRRLLPFFLPFRSIGVDFEIFLRKILQIKFSKLRWIQFAFSATFIIN